MPKKSSSKIVWAIIASLAVLGIVACIVMYFFFKPYTAVYLTTGDIYFGKASTFPCVKIKDAWFLQRSEDGNLGLQRFGEAVWQPVGEIKINRDQIVFTAKLSENSPIIQAIEGKAMPQQQAVPMQQGSGDQQQQGVNEVMDGEMMEIE